MDEKERWRPEEWRTDIPTVGALSTAAKSIVYYNSGLRFCRLKIGDLNSERHWLNRVGPCRRQRDTITGIPASCPHTLFIGTRTMAELSKTLGPAQANEFPSYVG